jgi:hypothetical protein
VGFQSPAPPPPPAPVPAPGPINQNPNVQEDYLSDSSDSLADVPVAAFAPLSTPLPPALTKKQQLKKERKKERKDRVLNLGRGPLLHSIPASAVHPVAERVAWDTEPELLCSYNWAAAEDGTNTLFVPGGPPRWTPRALPCVLQGDSGFHPTDYNYVRQPKDPFSAVFHALGAMNPGFSWYVLCR